MNQQNSSDEQNPYEYEKPVSATKFRKYGSVATLGLLAIGTAFGGSALAATVMATSTSTSNATGTLDVNGGLVAEVVTPDPLAVATPLLDATGAPIDTAIQIVAADPTVPAVQNSAGATPSKSPVIALPVLAVVDYGNVSSATPSASGSNAGSAGGSSWGEDDDDDDDRDDHDDREDHDDDNDDDDDDNDD